MILPIVNVTVIGNIVFKSAAIQTKMIPTEDTTR